MPKLFDAIIVGAGPSGLAAVKTLREHGLNAVALEAASQIGGAFRDDLAYEGMFLTISSHLMAFSDFPPPHRARYLSQQDYLKYLHEYVDFFGLADHIRLNCQVEKASFDGEKWSVTVKDQRASESQLLAAGNLIVSTGSNHVPKMVPLPGFTGDVLHSSAYKNNKEFVGKNVMVIGIGESSADICAEIGKVANSVAVWSRRNFMLAPRFLATGGPEFDEIEEMDTNAGTHKLWQFLESVTVSKAASLFPASFYGALRILLWTLLKKAGGYMGRLGHWCLDACEDKDPSRPWAFWQGDQRFVVTKSARMPIAVEKGQATCIVSKEAEFDGRTVRFPGRVRINNSSEEIEGKEMDIDVIVLCTGYQTQFKWLEAEVELNPRKWYKHCYPPSYNGKLAFLGWTRPHQGGIPPCSEMLARFHALLLSGKRSLPSDYAALAVEEGRREQAFFSGNRDYATLMDYTSFMDSVSRLIGCEPRAPAPWHLKHLIQYLTFPRWPCFYRSRGPGAKPELLDSVLSKYDTFEAVGPTHIHVAPIFVALQAFVNATTYLLSFSLYGKGLPVGWLFLKSKGFTMHGNDMRLRDVVAPWN